MNFSEAAKDALAVAPRTAVVALGGGGFVDFSRVFYTSTR